VANISERLRVGVALTGVVTCRAGADIGNRGGHVQGRCAPGQQHNGQDSDHVIPLTVAGAGAVTSILVLRRSLPVHKFPQSGQVPWG
jgi:hypothetical protein